MSIRKSLLLFIVGAGLSFWGTYAVSNISTIIEGQRWSTTFLVGLVIGALPLIVGAFLMVGVLVAAGTQLLARVRSKG